MGCGKCANVSCVVLEQIEPRLLGRSGIPSLSAPVPVEANSRRRDLDGLLSVRLTAVELTAMCDRDRSDSSSGSRRSSCTGALGELSPTHRTAVETSFGCGGAQQYEPLQAIHQRWVRWMSTAIGKCCVLCLERELPNVDASRSPNCWCRVRV